MGGERSCAVHIHYEALRDATAGRGQEKIKEKKGNFIKEELEISHHLSNKGQLSESASQSWPKEGRRFAQRQAKVWPRDVHHLLAKRLLQFKGNRKEETPAGTPREASLLAAAPWFPG